MTARWVDPSTGESHPRPEPVTWGTWGAQDIKPGMFGLSRIGGLLGKLISAGQAFSGDASRWTHAFIVLDDETVIEAMPGGARIVPLADRLAHDEVFFSDKPIQRRLQEIHAFHEGAEVPAETEEIVRSIVVDNARALDGIGYGYLQYVALGLVALGFRPRWLELYIGKRNRMMCSQLVDEVMRRSGIHLFDDGRLPQQVTPGDLALWAGAL